MKLTRWGMTPPEPPTKGDTYIDSRLNEIYRYDGAQWINYGDLYKAIATILDRLDDIDEQLSTKEQTP